MVQQKAETDASYKYPDNDPEPLSLNEKDLTPAQKEAAATIEKALSAP